MDDFPVNGFDNKVSRSSSSPNEAVLSVKLDFVKKTIPKYVLLCLIGFMDDSRENGSFVQLAGSTDPAAQQVFGLEDKITPQMPPVFVWTTMEDAAVPVENTLMLVNALHRASVPCEAHLFEKGVHGTSISTAEVDQPSRHRHHWVELAVEWLEDTFAFSVC